MGHLRKVAVKTKWNRIKNGPLIKKIDERQLNWCEQEWIETKYIGNGKIEKKGRKMDNKVNNK